MFQAEDGIRDYDVTGVQTCALPIYSLRFFDANFGVSEKRIKELCEGLIDRGHHFWWYALMQTNHIASYKSETLDAMRDSGMYCSQLGTETGDEGMMNVIGKKCPPDINERAITRLAKRGVCTLATYVIGFPRSEEHTSELQSRRNLVCRLLP